MEKLPLIEITKDSIERNKQEECSICKEEFKIGTKVNELPCSHAFHPECIVNWLKQVLN